MVSEPSFLSASCVCVCGCREMEIGSGQHEVKEIQDSLEDAGVTHLVPVPCSVACLEAEPEKQDVTKRIKSSELMQEVNRQQEREVCWCKES